MIGGIGVALIGRGPLVAVAARHTRRSLPATPSRGRLTQHCPDAPQALDPGLAQNRLSDGFFYTVQQCRGIARLNAA